MATTTLKEYVVKLGFKLDEATFGKIEEALHNFDEGLRSVASGVEKIGTAASAATTAVNAVMGSFVSKFTQLDVAAKLAKTSVSDLMKMEAAGQAGGFAPGQMTSAAIRARIAMASNPMLKEFMKGMGVDVDHGIPAMLQSFAMVMKGRYSEEKRNQYIAFDYASLFEMSKEELLQWQENPDYMRRGMEGEAEDQAKASGPGAEQHAKTARELAILQGRVSREQARIHDTGAEELSGKVTEAGNIALGAMQKFSAMSPALQATAVAIGDVTSALADMLGGLKGVEELLVGIAALGVGGEAAAAGLGGLGVSAAGLAALGYVAHKFMGGGVAAVKQSFPRIEGMTQYASDAIGALKAGGFEAMTKSFEGDKQYLYPDIGGTGTIGYGHVPKAGDPDFSKGLYPGQDEQLFQKDYSGARNYVLAQTKGIKLTEAQVGVLTDLVYRLGSLKKKGGGDLDVLQDIKAGLFSTAANDLLKYDTYTDPKTGKVMEDQGLYNRMLANKYVFEGKSGVGGAQISSTINVFGVQDPAAVAERVRDEESRMLNAAMRNALVRTA